MVAPKSGEAEPFLDNTLLLDRYSTAKTNDLDIRPSDLLPAYSCLHFLNLLLVSADNHVEEYLKEYLGSYNSGVWSNGVRTLRTGLGHFYSVDPEGPIPLNEATYGDIDNGKLVKSVNTIRVV